MNYEIIKSAKILVIDDNSANLNIVFEELDKLGSKVLLAQNGENGIRIAKDEEPDIILLDILMPRMNGFEVIKTLKENKKTEDIPVIFMTALGDSENIEKGFDCGAADYIIKPLEQKEFLARISTHLKLRQKDKNLHIALEKYKVLFQAFPLGISITDKEGNLIDCNLESERLLGLTGDVHSRLTYNSPEWKMIRPDGRTMPSEEYASVRAMKENRLIENVEMGIVKDNNHITWLNVTAAPIPLENYGVAATYGDITRRMEAEKKLRESEELYRSLFENMLNGFAYCRMIFEGDKPSDFVYISVNSAFETLTGLKNVTGKKVTEVIPGIRELDPGLLEIYGRVVLTGKPEKFETHLKSMDIWFSVSVYSPKREYFIAVFEIITERKKSEEQLIRAKERMELAQRAAGAGIWDWNIPTGHIEWSEELFNILGLKSSENKASFETWSSVLHPKDREIAEERIKYSIKQKILLDSRYRIIRPDGQERWINALGKTIYDEDGNPLRMTGICIDITDKKKTEDALRENQERMRFAMDTTHIGIWDIDLTDHSVFRSLEHARIFGYKDLLSEWTYEKFIEHILPEDRKMVEDKIKDSIKNKTSWNIECRILRTDGEIRWIWAAGRVQTIGNSKNLRAAGIVQDITEKKQAEEEKNKLHSQLIQSQKMESIGRLAGGVAHDFNNMLGIIISCVELAMDEIDPQSPIITHLETILSSAGRSADLTRQLLAFARKQTIAPKVLDLNEVVGGMIKMLLRLIGEDIDLLWKPSLKPCQVKIDPTQIDQILANLAVNARDAISGAGKITIEVNNAVFDEDYCKTNTDSMPGDYILLAVSDNGCGMDRETLSNIFEPFFTTKEINKGSGLGLATIYGIVRQNNGFIKAYSEPGMGTTFKIYLPGYKENPMDGGRKPQKEVIGGTETILLVEDEKNLLKMTETILKKLGYKVMASASPVEAFRIAADYRGEIHLLITDVIMPEMNGKDLAKQIISIHPGIKCLFMSGYTSNVIAHHGVLEKGVNFIHKPFFKEEMAAKIREALNG